MTYTLGRREDGWLVADPITLNVVKFAGCDLAALTREEAEVMSEMLADIDAANSCFEGPDFSSCSAEPQFAP